MEPAKSLKAEAIIQKVQQDLRALSNLNFKIDGVRTDTANDLLEAAQLAFMEGEGDVGLALVSLAIDQIRRLNRRHVLEKLSNSA